MIVGKGGDQKIACNPDGLRGESLYCKGQKTMTTEGKSNFDRIKWDRPKEKAGVV